MTAAALLLKVTVVLALALAGTRLARHSRAAVRHVLLAAAFIVVTILPVASVIGPTVQIAMPEVIQEAIAFPDDAPAVQQTTVAPVEPGAVSSSARPSWPFNWSTAVLALWFCGSVVFMTPLVVALWQVRSLRRSALPWVEGREVVKTFAVRNGIARPVDVLLHESLQGPMTCGVLRPAVVLPLDARSWTAEDLRRAIVHELEHVRRGDWASQVLARVAAAMYWFHPIVWVASRQLALEAERACDDAVLGAGTESSVAYADQLVHLAERLSASSSRPQLAMANRSDLATRVLAVLDHHQARGRAGTSWIAVASLASAVLIVAVSPLRLVAGAQSSQAAPTPATRLTYDAATIKRCEAEPNPTGARGTAGGTNATFSPGRFFVPCVTTEQLIYLAYASYGAPEQDRLMNDDLGSASNSSKIRGGPDWVHSLKEKYQIEATAAGATERTVLMGYMLRSLLEDRFKLKLHRDTEEVGMLALSVGKGLKLKPMKEGECDPDADFMTVPTDAKPRCGTLNMVSTDDGTKTRWTFGGFALSTLAGRISSQLKVHVIDRTNITDKFVFRFEFARDPDPLVTETAIFAAVEELGLKLEKTKAPRGFLVIDAIERPTPDGSPVIVPARASGPSTRPR